MCSANVLAAPISMSLPYFKAEMFGLTNAIPEYFSFNHQIVTAPSHTFLTFFVFVIVSCSFFSMENKSKFSRKFTLAFVSFLRLSMLVTSKLVSPGHFEIIS